jgi:hypothetical protein
MLVLCYNKTNHKGDNKKDNMKFRSIGYFTRGHLCDDAIEEWQRLGVRVQAAERNGIA